MGPLTGSGSSPVQNEKLPYEWPENEHGLHVDAQGFVWIVGNAMPQDGQILKFTKAGKFVMQIGKRGQTGGNTTPFLLGASGLRVHPKRNELFVSDGYGNSRVMVYDAATGAFKSMWGAYGRKPVDPPSIAIGEPTSPTSQIPSGIAERLQHFKTVHDVALSNDDLVYIADRGNKRIQVFTLDGTYVAQQFVGLDSPEYQQARSTAFSHDPEQRFLYVAGSPVIYILNRKTLEVLGEFVIGAAQANPPGHQIAADQHGNIYAPQAAQTGPDGKGWRLDRSEVRVQGIFAAAIADQRFAGYQLPPTSYLAFVAVQFCVLPAVVAVPSMRSPETLPVYWVSPTLNEICSPLRRPPAIGVVPSVPDTI